MLKFSFIFLAFTSSVIMGQMAQEPAKPVSTSPPAAMAGVTEVAEAKAALAKWMQTQQLLSQETMDWRNAKDLLADRISLLEDQIKMANEKVAEAEKEIGTEDTTKKENLLKRDELMASTESLRASLPKLEARVRTLHDKLPPVFQDKVAPLYQRIPTDPANTKVSLAERFQNVVGILNEIGKANSEMTVTTELRLLEGGKPTEVQTIYLGLAYAFYLSQAGDSGGWGVPGEKGWEWTVDNTLVKPLTEVFAVMKNKAKPKFIPLPIKIK